MLSLPLISKWAKGSIQPILLCGLAFLCGAELLLSLLSVPLSLHITYTCCVNSEATQNTLSPMQRFVFMHGEVVEVGVSSLSWKKREQPKLTVHSCIYLLGSRFHKKQWGSLPGKCIELQPKYFWDNTVTQKSHTWSLNRLTGLCVWSLRVKSTLCTCTGSGAGGKETPYQECFSCSESILQRRGRRMRWIQCMPYIWDKHLGVTKIHFLSLEIASVGSIWILKYPSPVTWFHLELRTSSYCSLQYGSTIYRMDLFAIADPVARNKVCQCHTVLLEWDIIHLSDSANLCQADVFKLSMMTLVACCTGE